MSKSEIPVFEVKSYTDLKGRLVQVFDPLSADGQKKFKGRVSVQFHPQMTPMTVEFPFDKEKTLEGCFATFDEVAGPHIAELQKKQMEQISRIVSARTMPKFPPAKG
jgi:hypothetical protein